MIPYNLTTASPEAAANILLCLINQASYLLGRQLDRLEEDFKTQGGFTERLYTIRKQTKEPPAENQSPPCPKCEKPMTLRTARKGIHAGTQFWGCTTFPSWDGTRPQA